MKHKDISVLLQKADELRALFVLGQRVIPFLEEIFIFVSEIQPLLDEINNSIQENLKKMPSASKQLSKVTEATEMATTEIMDIVDGILYKVDIINANFKRLIDISQKNRENPIKLLESIYKSIKKGQDLKPLLPSLATSIAAMKNVSNNETDKILRETDELIQSISNDSSSIMISLQVQDITAQQIAAVNNLLETIQGKLGTILAHFHQSDIGELVHHEINYDEKIKVSQLHRKVAFDPDAVEAIANKEVRQQQVDDLIDKHSQGGVEAIEENFSQDDIDALLAGSGADEEAIEEIAEEEVADIQGGAAEAQDVVDAQEEVAEAQDEEEDPFAQFSQDDIDALFGK